MSVRLTSVLWSSVQLAASLNLNFGRWLCDFTGSQVEPRGEPQEEGIKLMAIMERTSSF